MPLYEYKCVSCGKQTEFIHSFHDAPPQKCPKCGGALRKLLSSPAFQFKGSGFYATDYGKPGGKDEESASKDKEGESSSKEKEGGGDAKNEGGAEPKSDSAGDSSKEKKDSKDSSKEKKEPRDSSKARRDSGPGAASDGAAAKTSTAPDSPSKKNTRTK